MGRGLLHNVLLLRLSEIIQEACYLVMLENWWFHPAGEIAQQVKVVTPKPDDLISRAHTVEGESQLPQVIL